MNRIVRNILLLAASAVFLFSSFMVFRYHLDMRTGAKYTEKLAELVLHSSEGQPGSQAAEKDRNEACGTTPAQAAETISIGTSGMPAAQPGEKTATGIPSADPVQASGETIAEPVDAALKQAVENGDSPYDIISEQTAEAVPPQAEEGNIKAPADVSPVQPASEISDIPSRFAPVQVDFDVLWEENKDVVAWLYCPDTPINYPVVQALDNEYYLHRRLDGSESFAGTLFMDYRNERNLSDWNSVIYGHNMKNDSMFGTLTDYKKQTYFEAHPELFLLTPERDYAIRLMAGFVTTADAELYNAFNPIDDEKARLMENWLYESDFISGNSPASEDRLITLSTCSYEYSDARYVLIGTLEELADWEE